MATPNISVSCGCFQVDEDLHVGDRDEEDDDARQLGLQLIDRPDLQPVGERELPDEE